MASAPTVYGASSGLMLLVGLESGQGQGFGCVMAGKLTSGKGREGAPWAEKVFVRMAGTWRRRNVLQVNVNLLLAFARTARCPALTSPWCYHPPVALTAYALATRCPVLTLPLAIRGQARRCCGIRRPQDP
eukprot:757792-Rhodomonas_salina.2